MRQLKKFIEELCPITYSVEQNRCTGDITYNIELLNGLQLLLTTPEIVIVNLYSSNNIVFSIWEGKKCLISGVGYFFDMVSDINNFLHNYA